MLARSRMPSSIRRIIAKSPNSLSTTENSEIAGWLQSRWMRRRVTSRVRLSGRGVSRHDQVLSGWCHSSHRFGSNPATLKAVVSDGVGDIGTH